MELEESKENGACMFAVLVIGVDIKRVEEGAVTAVGKRRVTR